MVSSERAGYTTGTRGSDSDLTMTPLDGSRHPARRTSRIAWEDGGAGRSPAESRVRGVNYTERAARDEDQEDERRTSDHPLRVDRRYWRGCWLTEGRDASRTTSRGRPVPPRLSRRRHRASRLAAMRRSPRTQFQAELAHSTAYPSARAFSRTRSSRVTTTTRAGGSPSNSVVAKCTASSVRIGSIGNGLRPRVRIASVTATRKQRRSNRRSARTAARSWSAVSCPAARARRIARAASAIVSADVTRRPRVRTDFSASASRSSSAATSALDSM